jgi:hypothetical protein
MQRMTIPLDDDLLAEIDAAAAEAIAPKPAKVRPRPMPETSTHSGPSTIESSKVSHATVDESNL